MTNAMFVLKDFFQGCFIAEMHTGAYFFTSMGPASDVVAFIRRRVRFDLLRTCVISLRGYRKPSNNTSHPIIPVNPI